MNSIKDLIKDMNRDLPIGEKFKQGKYLFLIKESTDHYCEGCDFIEKTCNMIENLPYCFSEDREDNKHVIFEKEAN